MKREELKKVLVKVLVSFSPRTSYGDIVDRMITVMVDKGCVTVEKEPWYLRGGFYLLDNSGRIEHVDRDLIRGPNLDAYRVLQYEAGYIFKTHKIASSVLNGRRLAASRRDARDKRT